MLQFLEQPPFARTYPSARTVLTPEPRNGTNTNGTRYRVAVVGNGPGCTILPNIRLPNRNATTPGLSLLR